MRLCTEFTAVGKCVDALAKKCVNYTCFDFFQASSIDESLPFTRSGMTAEPITKVETLDIKRTVSATPLFLFTSGDDKLNICSK